MLQDIEGIEIVASLSALKYPKYVSVIWLSLQKKKKKNVAQKREGRRDQVKLYPSPRMVLLHKES